MRFFVTAILGSLLLSLSLTSCDLIEYNKEMTDYSIENSEMNKRRDENKGLSWPRLSSVPERRFDYPTLEEFAQMKQDFSKDQASLNTGKQVTGKSEVEQQNKNHGPYPIVVYKKVRNDHLVLAHDLNFGIENKIITVNDKKVLQQLISDLRDRQKSFFLIAHSEKDHGADYLSQQRFEEILAFMKHEKADHLLAQTYFGFDDEMEQEVYDMFPGLDRIVDNEILVYLVE